MKRLVILTAALMLGACSEKKPATPEELWQGYCTSVSNAARSITLDRQSGITKKEALDYANKVTDPTTKAFILNQIEMIYAYPEDQLKADKEKIRDQFKQQAYEICVKSPHDPNKMPDYKPF